MTTEYLDQPDEERLATQTTCPCTICGHHVPAAEITSQGGVGNLCPYCLAELASCGCSDESLPG